MQLATALPGIQAYTGETLPRALWIRAAVMYLVLGSAAWWGYTFFDSQDWWPHTVWCFLAMAAAVPVLVSAARLGFITVLTDHRVMLVGAFVLYYEFGALLLSIGPQIQAEVSARLYPIGAEQALRADAINGLGLGIALLTSAFSSGRWVGSQADKAAVKASRVAPAAIVGIFLSVGACASMYTLYFDMGMGQGVVPGVVRTGGMLSLAAIFLASSHQGTNETLLRALAVVLTLFLAVGGALTFMKAAALLPAAALTAGLAARFPSRKILPIGLALLAVGFMILGNLISYGRIVVGRDGFATPSERWGYLQEGWVHSRELSEEEEYPYWARLCYLPAQVAALDFQDAGQGGDGLVLLPWVFVPRLLFPEKPEISKTTRDFSDKVAGADTGSSVGVGIFVSGYYHGAWLGFVLAGILCGWVLAQTSAIARAVYSRGGLLMLPLALFGVFMGFRIDGDIVSDYVGAFVFVLYPLLVIWLVVPRDAPPRRFVTGKGSLL